MTTRWIRAQVWLRHDRQSGRRAGCDAVPSGCVGSRCLHRGSQQEESAAVGAPPPLRPPAADLIAFLPLPCPALSLPARARAPLSTLRSNMSLDCAMLRKSPDPTRSVPGCALLRSYVNGSLSVGTHIGWPEVQTPYTLTYAGGLWFTIGGLFFPCLLAFRCSLLAVFFGGCAAHCCAARFSIAGSEDTVLVNDKRWFHGLVDQVRCETKSFLARIPAALE